MGGKGLVEGNGQFHSLIIWNADAGELRTGLRDGDDEKVGISR